MFTLPTKQMQIFPSLLKKLRFACFASERSERGNPQIHTPLSSLRDSARKRGIVAIHKKGKDIDCYENPCGFSRNDE